MYIFDDVWFPKKIHNKFKLVLSILVSNSIQLYGM